MRFDMGEDIGRWLAAEQAKIARRPAFHEWLARSEAAFFRSIGDAVKGWVPEAAEIWVHGGRAIGEYTRSTPWEFIVLLPSDTSTARIVELNAPQGPLGGLGIVGGRRVRLVAFRSTDNSHLPQTARDEGFRVDG